MIEPLAQVEAGLLETVRGDLEVTIGLARDDELGEMTRAFDRMIVGLQERRNLGRYVSGSLEAELAGKTADTPQGPVQREGVILGIDIRNFTTISEKHPTRDVTRMLNRHLDLMSRAIQARGGLIETFIGDAIVAVFLGETVEVAASAAIEAALAMNEAHREHVRERVRAGDFPFQIGVGIDGGLVLMGTLSTSGRLDHVVAGDPRTHAETLEGLSKFGQHSRVIVSRRIFELCLPFPFTLVPGKDVFELLEDRR